jgi:hypothetical protein
MSKEQTPIEWLIEQLTESGINYNPLEKDGYSKTQEKLFEQAKQMDKKRMDELKDFDVWKEWKNKPENKKMNKEQAKDELIEVLTNQMVDLSMMSKIELGTDVIDEIRRLKGIIKEKQPKFKVGDKAHKPKGYKFPCTIIGVFENINGDIRVVGEMDEYGLLHIFNEEQLEHYE